MQYPIACTGLDTLTALHPPAQQVLNQPLAPFLYCPPHPMHCRHFHPGLASACNQPAADKQAAKGSGKKRMPLKVMKALVNPAVEAVIVEGKVTTFNQWADLTPVDLQVHIPPGGGEPAVKVRKAAECAV